jgi:hypothetical protein
MPLYDVSIFKQNDFFYIDRAKGKRTCTLCNRAIRKGEYHLASKIGSKSSHWRKNVCYSCLMECAKTIGTLHYKAYLNESIKKLGR